MEAMAKKINRMTGKDLAEVLPRIYEMAQKGVSREHIAAHYDLSVSAVQKYIEAYSLYLTGNITPRIERAVPFMQVKQASIKFTEERKRKPAERIQKNEPKIKTKNLRLLWGMIEINW